MTRDLKNVGWADFKDIWEECQSVPLVRCPWGCSKYYSKVNSVAFDVLVGWHLEGNVEFYSSKREQRCPTGF
jgi:hypothetical protein